MLSSRCDPQIQIVELENVLPVHVVVAGLELLDGVPGRVVYCETSERATVTAEATEEIRMTDRIITPEDDSALAA